MRLVEKITTSYNIVEDNIGWMKPLMIGSAGVLGSWGIQEWTDVTALAKNILSITVLLVTGLIAVLNYIDKRKKNEAKGS